MHFQAHTILPAPPRDSLLGAPGTWKKKNPSLPVANIPPGTAEPRSSLFRAQSVVPGRCYTLGAHPCRVGKDSPRCRENREESDQESEQKLSPGAQVKVSCKLDGAAIVRRVRTLPQPAARRAHAIFANSGLTASVTPAKLPYSKLRCQPPPSSSAWLPPLLLPPRDQLGAPPPVIPNPAAPVPGAARRWCQLAPIAGADTERPRLAWPSLSITGLSIGPIRTRPVLIGKTSRRLFLAGYIWRGLRRAEGVGAGRCTAERRKSAAGAGGTWPGQSSTCPRLPAARFHLWSRHPDRDPAKQGSWYLPGPPFHFLGPSVLGAHVPGSLSEPPFSLVPWFFSLSRILSILSDVEVTRSGRKQPRGSLCSDGTLDRIASRGTDA